MSNVDYEEENGVRRIYCTYEDTEVHQLKTNVECPHCGHQQSELDMDQCGKTYTVKCDDDFSDGCGKEYEMHFDAS